MNVYVDSSVILRVVFRERDRLRTWAKISMPVTSELTRVEVRRTMDRARLAGTLDDAEVAAGREHVEQLLAGFDMLAIDRRILRRAAEPLPTTLGTLDAIHLASALAARHRMPSLRLATHDFALARAARAVGFQLVV